MARPAVGKSVAIKRAGKFLRDLKEVNVAPDSLTRERLIVDLCEKCLRHKVIRGNLIEEYSSYIICSPEFGNLLPEDDTAFMNVLNQLYDCDDSFEYHTKNSGEYNAKNTHMVLFGGTQPNFLAKILPDAAFGLGFTSRLLIIYADAPVLTDIFKATEKPAEYKTLLSDLKQLLDLHGGFTWQTTAAEALQAYYRAGMPPSPTHSRLANYNSRRLTHLFKLCMIRSVDRGNDLFITLEDYEWAKATLLEAESVMPEAFKDMAASTDFGVSEELLAWMYREIAKQKRGLFDHEIQRWLITKVPSFRLKQILESMHAANMLKGGKILNGRQTWLPASEDDRLG